MAKPPKNDLAGLRKSRSGNGDARSLRQLAGNAVTADEVRRFRQGAPSNEDASQRVRQLAGNVVTADEMRRFRQTYGGGKWQNSPDRYEDAGDAGVPRRLEYRKNPENYTTAESPKRVSGTPGGVQQGSGTDSPRANGRDKSAGMPDTPKGKTQWGEVSSYNDSSELP